jgi:hypothetical protein
MTTETAPTPLAHLVDQLAAEHGSAVTRDEVAHCVVSARSAVDYFGVTDEAEMVDLVRRIAGRDLRLRLGLEREVARLDPEDHHRPPADDLG